MVCYFGTDVFDCAGVEVFLEPRISVGAECGPAPFARSAYAFDFDVSEASFFCGEWLIRVIFEWGMFVLCFFGHGFSHGVFLRLDGVVRIRFAIGGPAADHTGVGERLMAVWIYHVAALIL